MARRETRFRIDDRGRLEVIDPGLDVLDLLREIDPDYAIARAELPGFRGQPRLLRTRRLGTGLGLGELAEAPVGELWLRHRDRLAQRETGPEFGSGEASLLDLKIELARRVLEHCELCARRCGVNRLAGDQGFCHLGTGALVAEHFVHIAEEAPVNPSLVLSLAGCGLRCQYCQQGAILDPCQVAGDSLDPSLWRRLDTTGARSMSFVGGNPDESLYPILRFLTAMPEDWTLPVVWNTHAYSTWQTLNLLDGVVDAYLPDFKYGNESCGRLLSLCKSYFANAGSAIQNMLEQRLPVIARILVLPGHFECCHLPVLEKLTQLDSEWLFLSVRGQYCPDWNVGPAYGALNRRPTREEIDAVRQEALRRGLRLTT